MSTSKKTRGFSGFEGLSDDVGWDILRTRRFKTLGWANLAKPGRYAGADFTKKKELNNFRSRNFKIKLIR